MNCQQLFLIVVLTSNNTGFWSAGKTGKSWEDQCPETWDPKITTLGKADQSLGQNHRLEGQNHLLEGGVFLTLDFLAYKRHPKAAPPKFNSSHLKMDHLKRKVVFQSLFFRGYPPENWHGIEKSPSLLGETSSYRCYSRFWVCKGCRRSPTNCQ